jgi:hypothetical protein
MSVCAAAETANAKMRGVAIPIFSMKAEPLRESFERGRRRRIDGRAHRRRTMDFNFRRSRFDGRQSSGITVLIPSRAHFFSATREGLNRGRRKHGLRGFLSEESTLALESGGMAAALQIAPERGDSVAEAKCAPRN